MHILTIFNEYQKKSNSSKIAKMAQIETIKEIT